jgi:hypothetical protein
MGGQSTPYGFSILEKLAIEVFGNSEYALRLFPLLFSIISLILFYKVAKYYIKPNAVPIALGLFAITDPMVYFATELKPHSADVAIALLMYLAANHIQSKKITLLHAALFGVLGAVVLWFSHPSAFVLAGIGITLVAFYISKKEWQIIGKLSVSFLFWALSFVALYFIYTRNFVIDLTFTSDEFFIKQKAFMPLPPKSLSDIQWFIDILFRIFDFPGGITLSGVAVLAFLVGCVSIYRDNKDKFTILILPACITLIVSGFHLYPFVDRLVLFLVPFLFLFVAEGVEYIREKTSHQSAIIGIILIALLFIYPATRSAYHVIKPDSREEIKPVLNYIKNNWREGDVIYVYYMTHYLFEYYSKYHPLHYNYDEDDYVIGKAPRDWYYNFYRYKFTGFWDKKKPFSQPYVSIFKEYIEDLDKMKGHKRVWFLFTSSVVKSGIDEEKFFIYHLESLGKQLDSFGRPGLAFVYLYDLTEGVNK